MSREVGGELEVAEDEESGSGMEVVGAKVGLIIIPKQDARAFSMYPMFG